MKIVLIAALAENGTIGDAGKIPWHISDDLKRFKQSSRSGIRHHGTENLRLARQTVAGPHQHRPDPNAAFQSACRAVLHLPHS